MASRRSRNRRDKRAPVPDFDEQQPPAVYPRHGPSPAARAAQASAVRRSIA
jgi:hypothetical protein